MQDVENILECKSQNENFLNDFELPQPILECIKNIANKEGYKTYNIFQKQISTNGANYIGELIGVDIRDETEDSERETNIFVKQKILQEKNNFVIVDEVYERELFFYGDLWKVYITLQEDAAIPNAQRLNVAKFYEDSNIDVILLENATKKGFITFHRMDVMPFEFAELSTIALAKFHALSFVMKRLMPKYFQDYIEPLRYPIKFSDSWRKLISNMLNVTLTILEGDPCAEKVQSLTKNIHNKMESYMTETTSSSCCLCHGDYRMNNILANYNDGEVTDVLPVDFQLMHYGHPVQDFLYLIFLNSDQDFRRKHLSYLKNLYCNTLKEFLMYFNIDVESVYPRESFEKDYKERLEFGLFMPLSIMPVLFAPEDDVVDLSATDVRCNSVDPRFKSRIKGIIDDFIEWGYL